MKQIWSLTLALALSFSMFVMPASAQTQECQPVDQSTETVIPGVTLGYSSSFQCEDAPETGDYRITLSITNEAGSEESVQIDGLLLRHTTPGPRFRAPEATAQAAGLPLSIAPGESAEIIVSGSYALVRTGANQKANLHLRVRGAGADSGERFSSGILVKLWGEREQVENQEGPPPWAGGPRWAEKLPGWLRNMLFRQPAVESDSWLPPGLQRMAGEDVDLDDEAGLTKPKGPPPWAGGPPPWAGEKNP
jgi:hypothetical protein